MKVGGRREEGVGRMLKLAPAVEKDNGVWDVVGVVDVVDVVCQKHESRSSHSF